MLSFEKDGNKNSRSTIVLQKKSRNWRDCIGKLIALDLKSEWNQLEGEGKEVYIDKVGNNLLRELFLATDLYENLK